MRYYKANDNGIISVSTLDADGDGNITEKEYNDIVSLLRAMPAGKVLTEQNGEYVYINAPAPPDEDISAEEAMDILMGVSE